VLCKEVPQDRRRKTVVSTLFTKALDYWEKNRLLS